jgi:hypothetical protein
MRSFPRIIIALFETQRDATFLGIDFQHHDFNFLTGGNDFARMDIFLHPAHFRDMDEAFNAVFQFHKSTVIGDVGDAAGDPRIELEFRRRFIPWIGFQLFHAKADALRFSVDFHHLHTHALADRQHF